MSKFRVRLTRGPIGPRDGYGVYFLSMHGGEVLLAWFRSNGEAQAYVSSKGDIS